MRKITPLLRLFLAFFIISLCSCSGVKETLGLTREVPDEFEVTCHQTLEMPESSSFIAPGNQNIPSKPITLEKIIFGRETAKNNKPSVGEENFLEFLGAQFYKDIGFLIDQEAVGPLPTSQAVQQKIKSIIMFWKKDKKKPGKVIHAENEKKRLEKHDIPT